MMKVAVSCHPGDEHAGVSPVEAEPPVAAAIREVVPALAEAIQRIAQASGHGVVSITIKPARRKRGEFEAKVTWASTTLIQVLRVGWRAR